MAATMSASTTSAGADLDHVDPVLVAREDQVEIGVVHLRHGRIDDESRAVIGVDAGDADGRGRALEGRVADRESSGSRGAGEHIGVVLAVVAHDEDLDLDLIDKAIGEERTDRAIDHPHRQDFFLVRGALALAEAARELAGGRRLLAVIDCEGEEIEAFTRLGANNRRQNGASAVGREHSAIAQLGDLSRLEDQRAPADFPLDPNRTESHSAFFLLHHSGALRRPGTRAKNAVPWLAAARAPCGRPRGRRQIAGEESRLRIVHCRRAGRPELQTNPRRFRRGSGDYFLRPRRLTRP
jgi:hypothetical protein